MKKSVLLITLMLVLVMLSIIGCGPEKTKELLAKLETDIKALSNTLTSTQQELTATKKALTDAQEQIKLLQKQLQEASRQNSAVTEPQISEVPVVINPYPYYYNPYPRYPYGTQWGWEEVEIGGVRRYVPVQLPRTPLLGPGLDIPPSP
jgi:Sec-independent protein translocase protein TatA